MNPRLPVTLTIAGSDSGGGAGIQADLKTFHQFGVFGTTAVTAVTAQNTLGVFAVHPIPVAMVRAQLDALATDLPPRAIKTGMLANSELVEAVGVAVREHEEAAYVMDPVMVATSGDPLLEPEAQDALVRHLLPVATVVTPNLHEARILTGREVRTVDDARACARELVGMGAGAALVKGGHLEGDEAVDVLWDGSEEHAWRRPRMKTTSTHGTGCTLSAAIAAGLAHGRPLVAAVDQAIQYVARAIYSAPGLGSGRGPLNHFARVGD